MRLTTTPDGGAFVGPSDLRAPAEPLPRPPLSAEQLPRSPFMAGPTQQRAEVLKDVL